MRKPLEAVVLVIAVLLSCFLSLSLSNNGETTSSSMTSYTAESDRHDEATNRGVECWSYTLQGRRRYQEDRMLCNLHVRIPFYGEVDDVKVGVVAVFDGHGGSEASEMASKLLLDYLSLNTYLISRQATYASTLDQLTDKIGVMKEHDDDDEHRLAAISVRSLLPGVPHEPMHMKILKEALVRTIYDIDLIFSQEAYRNNLISGTTATVVLLVDGQILVANVGDSRALLCSQRFHSQHDLQGGLMKEFKRRRRISYEDAKMVAENGLTRLSAEELTREHHPDQADERKRVEAYGGQVIEWGGVPRVNGQLAVSRALGDVQYKRFGVIPSPEVMDWRRITANDSYLVVASDGIYETLTSQDVCDLLPFEHSEGYEKLKLYPSCEYPSAECILKTAFEEGSMDNLSAIVIPLKNLYNKIGTGG